ncbi:unnamed protein product [Nezara viridula]|uniref:Uncharacterized protein n=1 Tax=Nezara viridula TaxID=85310 RepID=A0A9P0HQY2_NEZVI|nr:unnamed protein product [Nezara viridula]
MTLPLLIWQVTSVGQARRSVRRSGHGEERRGAEQHTYREQHQPPGCRQVHLQAVPVRQICIRPRQHT